MAEPGAPVKELDRRSLMVRAGLLGVMIALTVLLVVQLRQPDPQKDEDRRRTEVVQVADDVAVRLTSMSKETLDEDYKAFLSLTTGDLRDSFEGQGELFTSLIKDSAVQSKGKVVAHGLVKVTRSKAEVLVATRADVTNKEAPEGQTREYRMRVTLVRSGHAWLADSLELVA